jgi:hypothetical protein
MPRVFILTGCYAFLDDTGPSTRSIEKPFLVRDNLLACTRFGKLGSPGEIGGAIRKHEFCYNVEADGLLFFVKFIAPQKIIAFVDDGSRRQAADERHMVVFVIVYKSLRLDAFSLAKKTEYF